MTTPSSTTVVDVQSSWFSKINWAQAVGILATILAVVTANKINIPAEQQVILVGVIQGVQALVTWVMRTWFTTTVTPASVNK